MMQQKAIIEPLSILLKISLKRQPNQNANLFRYYSILKELQQISCIFEVPNHHVYHGFIDFIGRNNRNELYFIIEVHWKWVKQVNASEMKWIADAVKNCTFVRCHRPTFILRWFQRELLNQENESPLFKFSAALFELLNLYEVLLSYLFDCKL